MLTRGWSDGHSFIPQQMELPGNRASDKRIGPAAVPDGRTHGATRNRVALQKTTTVAAAMVARSAAEGIPADYRLPTAGLPLRDCWEPSRSRCRWSAG